MLDIRQYSFLSTLVMNGITIYNHNPSMSFKDAFNFAYSQNYGVKADDETIYYALQNVTVPMILELLSLALEANKGLDNMHNNDAAFNTLVNATGKTVDQLSVILRNTISHNDKIFTNVVTKDCFTLSFNIGRAAEEWLDISVWDLLNFAVSLMTGPNDDTFERKFTYLEFQVDKAILKTDIDNKKVSNVTLGNYVKLFTGKTLSDLASCTFVPYPLDEYEKSSLTNYLNRFQTQQLPADYKKETTKHMGLKDNSTNLFFQKYNCVQYLLGLTSSNTLSFPKKQENIELTATAYAQVMKKYGSVQDATTDLQHFVFIPLLTNTLHLILTTTSKKDRDEILSNLNITEGEARHIRNALAHGRYFNNNDDGIELYDGDVKRGEPLVHIKTLSVREIGKAIQLFLKSEVTDERANVNHPSDPE